VALKDNAALQVDPLADRLTFRICSVMSLNPYIGSLIPVLKEMTKTFCKFLPVIFVLYRKFICPDLMVSLIMGAK
jgi:hypothetical protein